MLTTPENISESAKVRRALEETPRWLDRVPLYQRPQYAEPRATLLTSSAESFLRLPFITKSDLRRDFPRNFLPPGTELEDLVDRDVIELEHTSGTSEPRTALLLGRGWWAEQEERALRRNAAVSAWLDNAPNARRVVLSSPVCSGDICYSSLPATFDRTVGGALYLSLSRQPFLWSEAELVRMAEETAEWQPLFIDADPVYGMRFAQYCERMGIRFPSLRFIICTYEFVSVTNRRILERAFGVPVFNLYGSTETGHLLMEDGRHEMLPSDETAYLEVVDPNAAGVGELIVTTLTNEFMPLLRYRIGDLVARREEPYHTSYVVHGRVIDAFHLPGGGRVTTRQVDDCFAGVAGISHYQLLQRGDGDWLLRLAADGTGPGTAQLAALEARLRATLGVAGKLEVQFHDLLLPEPSGKFRLCVPARD